MKKLTILALSALFAVSGAALADHGKGKHKKDHEPRSAPEYTGFSNDDADRIREYYRADPQSSRELPPGLAKKGKLPPGWQKKLQVGERVPDDVWQHRVPVPREIRIGDTPAGSVNVRINDRILRVVERTREVLDVVRLPIDPQRTAGPPR